MLAAAISLLAAVIAAFITHLAIRFCARRSDTLARARKELDQFYAAAQQLLQDDTLPDSVATFVEMFSRAVMHPKIAAWMARDVLSGAFYEKHPPRSSGQQQFGEDIERLNQDQRAAFAECIAYGLLVSAASNLLRGERTRALVLFGLFNVSPRSAEQQCEASPQKAVGIALEIANDFGAKRHWAPEPEYA